MPSESLDYSRTMVMACATVIEEMLPLLPPGMPHQVFEFGLHVYPDKLRRTLQSAIDAVGGQYDTIILGYGLCSQVVVGIQANGCRSQAGPSSCANSSAWMATRPDPPPHLAVRPARNWPDQRALGSAQALHGLPLQLVDMGLNIGRPICSEPARQRNACRP